MLVPLLVAAMAVQQPGLSPTEAGLLACSGKPDDERLACYDRIAGLVSDRVLSGAAAPQTAPPQAALPQAAPTGGARRGMSAEDIAAQSQAAARGEPLRAGGAAAPAASADPAPTLGRNASSTPAPQAPGAEDFPFEAGIARIAFDPYEDAIITLADGQVWRQLRSDSRKLRERDAERAETAVVKKAAFGSFRMTIEPSGRTLRVRRVE